MARFISLHRSPGLSKEDFAQNGAEIVNGKYAQHVVTYINFFDGTIVNLADMKPQTTDPHCSAGPVRYVLEMNKDWFAKKGIKAGTKLQGSLFQVQR